jgi:hypothetical protein
MASTSMSLFVNAAGSALEDDNNMDENSSYDSGALSFGNSIKNDDTFKIKQVEWLF